MIDDLLKPLVTAAIGIVIAAAGWIVRRIFTNQKELEEGRKGLALLEQKVDFQHRETTNTLNHVSSKVEEALAGQKVLLEHVLKKDI